MNKRFVVTGLLIFFSLGFLLLLPASDQVNPIFQGLVVSIAFFLVIPFLYCKIVLKESLKNMGWAPAKAFPGIVVSLGSIVIALILIMIAIRYTEFSAKYIFPVTVQVDFFWFILYELVLVSFTAFLYESFFRGLIQMLWLKNTGFLSIIASSVIFTGFLFLSGEISWQKFPILLFSPFAGIIAYYSRSLWYSWIASWIFFFLTDVLLLVQK